MITVLGMRIRPSPGRPPAAFTALAETGATQKNAPTVGFEIPPQGASALPETESALPMTPLSKKHWRFLETQV